jgi:hypothetical protein
MNIVGLHLIRVSWKRVKVVVSGKYFRNFCSYLEDRSSTLDIPNSVETSTADMYKTPTSVMVLNVFW